MAPVDLFEPGLREVTNTEQPEKAMRSSLVAVIVLLCHVGPLSAQQFEWQKATPESQGMSAARLDALKDDLAKRRTRALLVIRNDRIVYEWYAEGVEAKTKQGTASLAKALVGGLSLGVAITDKLIALDDPAAKYIP